MPPGQVVTGTDQVTAPSGGEDLGLLDISGDGQLDILANFGDAGGLQVWNSNAGVRGWQSYDRPGVEDVKAVDFDGDGRLDLATDEGDNGLFVYTNASRQWVQMTDQNAGGTTVVDDGADTLVGGDGDDTILGLSGNDDMTGGLGADMFVFGDQMGHDVIQDFGNGGDMLDFSAVSSVSTVQEVLDSSTVIGGDTVITLDGLGDVTLMGYTNLSEADIYI